MTEPGALTGFEDYLTRAKDGQDKIYYLTGTDRASVEAGPYLEALRSRGLEVIYFLENIDEYLLQHLSAFDGKELVSAASADLELEADDSIVLEGEPLAESEMEALCEYLKSELAEQVEKVAPGNRLVSSPAAVLAADDGMSAQMRNMMRAMNPEGELPAQKVQLEVTPRHALIHALSEARASDPDLAKLVAGQLLDNALLSAGMLEDRGGLIQRGFELMEKALKKSSE